ncbi:MAG: hypothetical protein HC852_14440 [Acaryochloridaceae cyanobacterium RU_4_10]|nr:hypothetical protein [Acaryochloridaceae cyanobacterium RU_4_10]
MVALPEKVQRFAHWSGAKLRPQEPVALEIDLPNFVADSERPPEQEPTESLVESKFQRNNKPWKNPKITLATAIGIAAAISAIGFFAINSNIQWPTIGGPTLGTANNDDKEPVDHPDGKVQTAALTGTLGEGLDKDANPKNPFLTHTKPADAHPAGKPKTTPSTHIKTLPASAIPATTPVVATAPRVMPRRAYTDYNDGGVTAPVRTGYSRTLRQTFAPRASAPASSTPVKEKSAEERRAERSQQLHSAAVHLIPLKLWPQALRANRKAAARANSQQVSNQWANSRRASIWLLRMLS